MKPVEIVGSGPPNWPAATLGQFIYVVPDKDVVIDHFGERFGYNRCPELLRSIADNMPS